MRFDLYPWQREAIERIAGRNAVVSAPTGAGKTAVAYAWAGLPRPKGQVFFTAPIKALSNERFRDLRRMLGDMVGIETGDVKHNTFAPVLCLTQEIYTNKYTSVPDAYLIVDEFHYVSQDSGRARAYIDGLRRAHPSVQILVMSATLGDPPSLAAYLERLAGRPFVCYQTNYRPTSLRFRREPFTWEEISKENAIVFVFSQRGVLAVAEYIAGLKAGMDSERLRRIEKLAGRLGVDLGKFPSVWSGVGVYFGNLLPKEKLFMERAFRDRLLDQMVSTDALALGVNMPARCVVFAQLSKYYDGPITKNEFLQMAGRAGRPGFFNEGVVGFVPSGFEAYRYNTGELYDRLLEAEPESFTVSVSPDWVALIAGKVDPESDAEFVAAASCPAVNRRDVLSHIQAVLAQVNEEFETLAERYSVEPSQVKDLMMRAYFRYWSVTENINLLRRLAATYFGSAKPISFNEIIVGVNVGSGRGLNLLLQFRNYYSGLSRDLKARLFEPGFQERLEKAIRAADKTVMDPFLGEKKPARAHLVRKGGFRQRAAVGLS